MIRALLAAAVILCAFPVRAQVGRAPAIEKDEPSCVCDRGGFKPITDKAVAVQEYWQARRKVKMSTMIAGTAMLFNLLTQNQNAMARNVQDHEVVRSEMFRAKARAEALDALKVTGDDLDGEIEIKLKKGVDYEIEP